MYDDEPSRLLLHEGAIYQIELLGALDPGWAEALGDMMVERVRAENDAIVTRLTGELADQAALAGILNLAYSLGMPLLSVVYLGKASHDEGASS